MYRVKIMDTHDKSVGPAVVSHVTDPAQVVYDVNQYTDVNRALYNQKKYNKKE